jgi:hypothetical protein
MQVPMIAAAKSMRSADVSEAIHCAMVGKPDSAGRHKREMLRYFVLVIALVAVFLLIAIALYYTQGKSITIEHVSSIAPYFSLSA